MRRGAIFFSFFASAVAFGQAAGGDDWNTFPGPSTTPLPVKPRESSPSTETPPVPEAPPPAIAPPPAASVRPPVKDPVEAPVTRPAPEAPTVEPVRTSAPPHVSEPSTRAGSAEEGQVVSTQERLLPGTEPHSPSTWGNRYDNPANARVSTGIAGVGVLHTSSADLGKKGVLRFSVTGEYLARTRFPNPSATNIRSAGTFGVSLVPLEWAELFLGYAASANTNSASSPNLIQTLGDLTFGGKAVRRFEHGLSGGLELKLQSFSGVGNQGIDRDAFGFSPRLLGTWDLRQPYPRVPLRLHANVGFAFDGTGSLVRNHTLTTAEEFALGVNRYNRFLVGAAVEVPLPAVTPFLEYTLGVPMGATGSLLSPSGAAVSLGAAMPQTLGLGLKVTAIKDLTLLVAADFGLSRAVATGIPATSPFNALFGAAFNIDPFQRGETRVVETIRERPSEKRVAAVQTGKVSGTVVDAKTQKPIPGVIVAMAGAGLPPVASDAARGYFVTHELPPGPVHLTAQKEGYKEVASDVVLEAGQTAQIQLLLETAVKGAHFELRTSSKGKAVAATTTFEGPAKEQAVTSAGRGEPVKLELPAGKYAVTVAADGFLSQTREVQAAEGATMKLDFELRPEPSKKLVIVRDNKIEVLHQVHFANGKAALLADSFGLLQQVVSAAVKNNVKRLRVEGHTDNKGDKAANRKLSQARANAVADYLASQGLDRRHIEAVGMGDQRPIAPNLTARGRELNRRVDFLILEK